MKIIAIIPARGGSTRIVDKNLCLVAGKPLLQWSVEAAQNSEYISDIVVSTDDQRIARAALSFGALVVRRNPAFAQTLSSLTPVFKEVAEKYGADVYVILRPTSPIRTGKLIDEAIKKFEDHDADTLVTGYWTTERPYPHDDVPSQTLPRWFVFDGNIEIQKRYTIMHCMAHGGIIAKMVVQHKFNLEVDEPDDVFVVSAVLEKMLHV